MVTNSSPFGLAGERTAAFQECQIQDTKLHSTSYISKLKQIQSEQLISWHKLSGHVTSVAWKDRGRATEANTNHEFYGR